MIGEFSKAIQCFDQAAVQAEDQGHAEGVGYCRINLANIHSNLGNHSKAATYGRQAVDGMNRLARRRGLWQALVTLGNVLADWGDACEDPSERKVKWQEAGRCFEQAEKVAKALRGPEGRLLALLNRATVFMRQDDPQAAIDVLEDEALPIAEDLEHQRMQGYCYINRADAEVMVGERKEEASPGSGRIHFDQAEADYQEALPKLKATADDRGQRAVYSKLGALYARWLEDMEKAYHYYETAINLWERTRGLLVEETHRIGFLGQGLDAYTGLTLLCTEMDRSAEALTTAERAKSRTLLERLAHSQVRDPEKVDPRLPAREAKLATELQRVGYALGTASVDQHGELTDKMNKLRKERDKLLAEMEVVVPDYAALRRGAPLTFGEIRECLELE